MIPIVSIVGKSDSGKTTLMEKLLPELVRRGYRVATVKHDVHGFEVDQKGKDSWRHKKAGAHTVVLSSSQKVALIRDVDEDMTLEDLRAKFIRDVDLILSEGYKKDVQPKIEVFRKEKHKELLCSRQDNLVAIVSDKTFRVGVPCFGLDDMRGLGDFIETNFLRAKRKEMISLKVDGKPVPLKPFVSKFLAQGVQGMVKSLEGCQEAMRIEIVIEDDERL